MDRINEYEFRVRYAETDRMGVVYYGNYLTWFELGRSAYMREGAYSYSEMEDDGYVMPVIKVSIEYLSSAFYDRVIVIRTRAKLLGKVRIQFDHEILDKESGTLLARGYVKLACMKSGIKNPAKWPEKVLKAIEN